MTLRELIRKLQWLQEDFDQEVVVVNNISQKEYEILTLDPLYEDSDDEESPITGVIIYIE